jgi:UDP-N-acetylglucosamine:LPS N-acetylglucosamine transferase
MPQKGFVVVTDRGGHLHNAQMLLAQMALGPEALVTTYGPDIAPMRTTEVFEGSKIISIPHSFTWLGKVRIWNPFKFTLQCMITLFLVIYLRPKHIVSLGGSNVVPFCYWAKLLGAKVWHVECMNQVVTPSITGRLLYPICNELFVQWKELELAYPDKAS